MRANFVRAAALRVIGHSRHVGGIGLGPLDRFDLIDEGAFKDCVELFDRDDFEAFLHIVRHLGKVLLILFRDENSLHTA